MDTGIDNKGFDIGYDTIPKVNTAPSFACLIERHAVIEVVNDPAQYDNIGNYAGL